MGYTESIHYLYSLQKHGIKLGLGNTRRLLALLGSPQESFSAIHIAGTNGKGSTSAMVASMLQSAGFRTGLFTSPHLVRFTERIQVNRQEISERGVVELTDEIKQVIERSTEIAGSDPVLNPTFFEFVTAMAFLYFKRQGIAWAVVETGMGGRLDATNVLLPRVSAITPVSYDHQEFLGRTLREIAGEKAGIIKKGIPVVSAFQVPEARSVIADRAREQEAPALFFGEDFGAAIEKSSLSGSLFSFRGQRQINRLSLPLCGAHQVENAAVALRVIEAAFGESLPEHVLRDGLLKADWPGRFELLRKEGAPYDIVLDGAHNPSAACILAETLREHALPEYGKIILILGIMGDKDIRDIMKPLIPLATDIILTSPDYERSASPEDLSGYASALGFHGAVTAPSVQQAIEKAVGRSSGGTGRSLIVITGSFYTLGEAKVALGQDRQIMSLAGLR